MEKSSKGEKRDDSEIEKIKRKMGRKKNERYYTVNKFN